MGGHVEPVPSSRRCTSPRPRALPPPHSGMPREARLEVAEEAGPTQKQGGTLRPSQQPLSFQNDRWAPGRCRGAVPTDPSPACRADAGEHCSFSFL